MKGERVSVAGMSGGIAAHYFSVCSLLAGGNLAIGQRLIEAAKHDEGNGPQNEQIPPQWRPFPPFREGRETIFEGTKKPHRAPVDGFALGDG
jgi:hypothetical protein